MVRHMTPRQRETMILSVISGSPFLLYPIKTNKYILYLMYYLKKNTVKKKP